VILETIKAPLITETEISVFKCLAYFDVFQHPLTVEEIVEYCEASVTKEEVKVSLNLLLEQHLLAQHKGYYFLRSSGAGIVDKRNIQEVNAREKTEKAKRYSSLIAKFPFVEGVALSGSFSKGVLGDNADIDYFIITRPGRLWLCRSLLTLYKKTVLLNSRKFFCINYFISSDNLAIPDKNIFVATELKTLLPVYNSKLFRDFEKSNTWADEFLPNKNSINYSLCEDKIKRPPFSRFLQNLFKSATGNMLDKFFFKLTLRRWQKKFPGLSFEDFDLNLRSRKNVSKHHPRGFQKKVLEAVNTKMNVFNTL